MDTNLLEQKSENDLIKYLCLTQEEYKTNKEQEKIFISMMKASDSVQKKTVKNTVNSNGQIFIDYSSTEEAKNSVKRFLECYENVNYYKETDSKNDMPTLIYDNYIGQKLIEIISLNPEFKNSKLDKDSISSYYNFLIEKMNSLIPAISGNFPDSLSEIYFKPIKKDTVRKWFVYKKSKEDKRGNKPAYCKIPGNRVDFFRISFALNLPLEANSKEPMLRNYSHNSLMCKIYHQRSCLKKPDELIFKYGLQNHLSYAECVAHILDFNKRFANYSAIKVDKPSNVPDMSTNQLEKLMKNHSIEEYKEVLLKSYSQLTYDRINHEIDKLEEEITEDDFIENLFECRKNKISDVNEQFNNEVKSREEVNKKEDVDKKKNERVIDNNLKNKLRYCFLKYGDFSDSNPTNLKREYKCDFIITNSSYTSRKINKLSENTNYDKLRKIFIHYHFITYWSEQDKKYTSESYLEEINRVLVKELRLPELYIYDKFDLFYILLSHLEDPLTMLLNAYSQVSGVKNDKQ